MLMEFIAEIYIRILFGLHQDQMKFWWVIQINKYTIIVQLH